jgi:hypothetical protein
MRRSTIKRIGALAAHDSELALSAPSGNGAHRPNPSTWPREAFLRLRNLRRRVVAVPRAEWVGAWFLAGGGRGGGGDRDGSGGGGDMGGRMARAMQGCAGRSGVMHGRSGGCAVKGPDGVATIGLSRESSGGLRGVEKSSFHCHYKQKRC